VTVRGNVSVVAGMIAQVGAGAGAMTVMTVMTVVGVGVPVIGPLPNAYVCEVLAENGNGPVCVDVGVGVAWDWG
jgi:thiazole synthase ThiGH ThiG subunit